MKMWDTLRRWRTWIVNALAAVLLVLPEVISAMAGFDWGVVIPAKYMPFITLAIIVANVWMRPRAAVLPSEYEDGEK